MLAQCCTARVTDRKIRGWKIGDLLVDHEIKFKMAPYENNPLYGIFTHLCSRVSFPFHFALWHFDFIMYNTVIIEGSITKQKSCTPTLEINPSEIQKSRITNAIMQLEIP